ncbi:MAG: hypothetical protein QOF57_152, partial [Frankiaceae bacterium]|nr:hypothetical protein [Frankiaceae bacterium]
DVGRKFWWPSPLSKAADSPEAVIPPSRGAPEESVPTR